MSVRKIIILILFFVFFPLLSFSKNYVEGEIIVKYREWVKPHQKKELIEKHKLNLIKEFPRFRLHRIKVPKEKKIEDLIEKLKKEKHIEYVEPNYIRKPFFIPNDTDYSIQWNLAKIKMESAWNIAAGSGEIIVAVVDTGVDYNHPDLKGNIWKNTKEIPNNGIDDDGNGFVDDIYGYDFCKINISGACQGHDNDPMDTHGHGTIIAGIIGAMSNNGKGITGINHRISIMPVKFMDKTGDVAAEIEAFEYAAKMGAKIINASYGDKSYSQAEKDAIEELGRKGILFVCAAGNDGKSLDSEPLYPASYNLPNMIIVGSTGKEDNLSSFSNYGSLVHITAPGESLYSTSPHTISSFQTAFIKTNEKQIKAYGMEYSGITKGIASNLIFCGKAKKDEIPDDLNGKIALIERGDITFREKVLNVMEKGAVGAIIYNNVYEPQIFNGTLGEDGNYIPVVSTSKTDGEALKAAQTPVTLVNYPFTNTSGTSFATPHVTAVAALLLSLKQDVDYLSLKNIILETADTIPSLEGKIEKGRRLNAYNAILNLKSTMPDTFTLNLKNGWNFISIPLHLNNPLIDQIFQEAKPKIIYTYDGAKKKWIRFKDGFYNEFLNIEPGKGYWIFMENEASLKIVGRKADRSIRLYNGWNLMGVNSENSKTVEEALEGIKDKWVIVWTWGDSTWYAKGNGFSVPLPSINTFIMGKAYWILINGADEEGIEWQQ